MNVEDYLHDCLDPTQDRGFFVDRIQSVATELCDQWWWESQVEMQSKAIFWMQTLAWWLLSQKIFVKIFIKMFVKIFVKVKVEIKVEMQSKADFLLRTVLGGCCHRKYLLKCLLKCL